MTPARQAREGTPDPVAFSVFISRMRNIVDEMSAVLNRAAMTPIIALCHDFSCCVYDADFRQVAVHDALPIQTSSMDLIIREAVDVFAGDLSPGDVVICNDPAAGNTHVGDLVAMAPVFSGDDLIFWSCARAHQLDVGAPIPSTTTPWAKDIWQEGLTIPPTKLYERGRQRVDVLRLYLANLRWPDFLLGDLMAQLGAIWTGCERLEQLEAQLGKSVLLGYVQHAYEYGRDRTAGEFRQIPDGTYESVTWMDADGGGRRNVEVRATVRVTGDTVSVDYAGSAKQSDSGFNASRAVMEAAGRIPLIMVIDPDIPHNQGCIDRIEVSAPEGTLTLASAGASTGGATTWPGDVMQEAVWQALAKAVPDRVRAGTARWNNAPEMFEAGGDGHEPWGLVLMNGGGGGGAAEGADGWPLIISSASGGGLKVASLEETELLYPLTILHWEIEPDSMGPGRWVGGPGVRLVLRPDRGPIDIFNPSDGLDNPPHGVCGGGPGGRGGSFVLDGDGSRTFLESVYAKKVNVGETWTSVSSGGGGYGPPLDRSADVVALECLDGVITADRARDVFGVILAKSGEVDRAATESLRAKLRAGRTPSLIAPSSPAGRTWAEAQAEPSDRIERFE